MMALLRHILPTGSTIPQDEDESSSFTNLLSHFQGSKNELQSILQSEQTHLFVDEQIRKVDLNFSQSELDSLTNEVLDSEEFLQELEQVDFSDITNLGQSNDNIDEFIETLGPTCEECMTYEKVHRITQISPGDHIRFHKRFVGWNVYNHHAIVTDVEAEQNQRVGKMTLIHFQKGTQKITVLRETKEYDMEKEEIEIVRYQWRPFTPEQIVDRANKMADKFEQDVHAESYNLFGNNCEEKSNEIATGSKFSNQVSSFANYVKYTISWLLKLLLKGAIKFCEGIKPFIRGFAHIAVIASLLSMVDRMATLKDKLKKGLMCLKCYEKEHKKMTVSLIFCLISIGISVMFHVSCFYFAVSAAIAVALPCVSSFVMDTIMPLIQPASKIPKPVVKRCNMIRNGDVITFPYVGLNHEGVVTSVSPYNTNDLHEVKLTLVHFNYPGLFGTRTVVKEVFFFDLKKDYVYVYDFSQEKPFQSQDVVKRALDRCGDQNFSTFSNRSSHMSRHCKTGKTELKTLPFKTATEITHFSPGDIIDFTYYSMSHEAVVVKVEYPETIKCSVVHYNYAGVIRTRTIVEEDFIFKLADQNIFVHDYTGCDIYPPEEVVRRAKSRLDEQNFNTFKNRSSHFAKWCKINE
ncbi:uncharacterized protein LOC127733073 [Mytilus californianus]|uniref:uncharacterized protein LOC127733073 n=1 Tax=Mytilus californianus TaxID=6549 RepID=UPI0022457FCD|nr:uncharacterized protein LOC127733073 [Mytilus californianus]